MKVYAGELIGRVLKQEGVTRVFGLCGGHVATMIKGIVNSGIEFIGTHHEESAVHMAEAWARATHHIGVVLVTAGPGVANAVPGMIAAYKAKSPVVVLSGRSSELTEDMEDAQELDQLAIVQPITKWAKTVHNAYRIPEMVGTAIRMATSGRPGVTFLDIPKNIATEEEYKIEEDELPELRYRTKAKPFGDPKLVEEALSLLLNAQRPMLLVGTGAIYADAEKELNDFCEKSGVPAATWKFARGIVPDNSKNAAPIYALTQADVIMVLGTQIDWSLNFGKDPLIPANSKLIQVDIDASEIGHNRCADIGIVGDLKMVLIQMLDCLKNYNPSKKMQGWPPEFYNPVAKAHIASVGKLPKESIDLIDLCVTVNQKLNGDAIVVADGGETSFHSGWYMNSNITNGLSFPPTLGHLGYGLPAAISLKMAYPDKQVVLVTGDGSLGFSAMEMNTALRYDVPVKIVVANDSAWGNIQNFFMRIYGYAKGEGTELNEILYHKMLEGLGGKGELVTKFSELSAALDRMLASDKPYLVNVRTDNSISIKRTTGGACVPME